MMIGLVFAVFLCTQKGISQQPNVLLICVDDLRPELHCYGVGYIESPNIDKLASQGRLFSRHYVQAPTCGASRFSLLTGTYGSSGNGALFQRAAKLKQSPTKVFPSMPAWFRERGYTTVSVGKVSHHPGGRGGSNWDDDLQPEMPNSWDRHLLPAGDWKHPRGWMHGLAHGEIRTGEKLESGTLKMDVFQALEGEDAIYPDGGSIDEAIKQMELLTKDPKPFFLAVGILRPHLPFGAPRKYLEPYLDADLPPIQFANKPQGKTTWHRSGEFMRYNRWGKDPNQDPEFAIEVRKHYAACVSYADAQVGKLLQRLEEARQADNTIVVLWGDHGWHLGEHQIWGKHSLFEESLHSPLIIKSPSIDRPGERSEAIVEAVDLFPTLCELAGLDQPDFVDGTSIKSILNDPNSEGHPAYSYKGSTKTVRTESHRLILHQDGFAELYDHRSEARESQNVADANREVVEELTRKIQARFK
jgi:iduronate 2-sulfatase